MCLIVVSLKDDNIGEVISTGKSYLKKGKVLRHHFPVLLIKMIEKICNVRSDTASRFNLVNYFAFVVLICIKTHHTTFASFSQI